MFVKANYSWRENNFSFHLQFVSFFLSSYFLLFYSCNLSFSNLTLSRFVRQDQWSDLSMLHYILTNWKMVPSSKRKRERKKVARKVTVKFVQLVACCSLIEQLLNVVQLTHLPKFSEREKEKKKNTHTGASS